MVGRKVWLAALALGVLPALAQAATVSVRRVDRSHPGWVRIWVRYTAKVEPRFRVIPICQAAARGESVLAALVSVAPRRRLATIDLRDDLAWLADSRAACRVEGLGLEMLEGDAVVASARLPLAVPTPPLVMAPPPPPARGTSRLGFAGQKLAARQTRMSEAGVTWSLSDRLTLHLSYERTAYAPIMPQDHDDGILTGLRVGF